MTNESKSIRQKMFFSAMVIAFMWVITGDLVAFHLELIYGKASNNWHQPYAKTHKDDVKVFKVKTQKADNSSKSKQLHFLIAKSFENYIVSQLISFSVASSGITQVVEVESRTLRGPPSLV